MDASRIPTYDCSNPDGMLIWFAEMANRDLLFHPEESARNIIRHADGKPLFTVEECVEADKTLAAMFAEHGDDVIRACYPIFMRKAGFLPVLDA